ncbi:MAG: hypothetical protein D6768_08090 [Chloroflexi bacterium]|nr:MAG: hypothetical protein D6768_08090 [Chloroflexota bacterium]
MNLKFPEMKRLTLIFAPLFLALLLPAPGGARAQSGVERIAFAAYRNGQWDIYSMAANGSNLRRLTHDPFEDTDPAFSPDGQWLAYASRREQNWDVYLLNLSSGEQTRLTTSPHYDGAPTWRPDGEAIAFESYRAGNLDIWQMPRTGDSDAQNLTANSDSGDFGPAYAPNGQTIAFSSWRNTGKDLYLLNPETGETTRLTNSPAAEMWPAWNSAGDMLAFVTDDLGDREVYTLNPANPPAAGGPAAQHITWLGRTDGPAWSPDGRQIAAVFHRWDGEQVTLTTPGAAHRLPAEVTAVGAIQGRLAWHPNTVDSGEPVATLADPGSTSLYEETVTKNTDPVAEPYNLIRQNNIKTGTPWLADTVDDSFQAWRQRMQAEVGFDFLAELSDASRDVAAYSETSQYASWHKSGRAVDTLFDFHVDGRLMHEIVKEDYSGETYWRIYLRCTRQDGSCGRPLTANPWNYSRRARVEIAPEQGGIEKAIPSGYYLDMTALAREYGWDRISSYDDDEFSWTWNFLAFEYWHYQKRFKSGESANWYRAMQDIYPPETLQRFFSWQKMRQLDEDPHLIALKGIPLPLEQRPWWSLVQP